MCWGLHIMKGQRVVETIDTTAEAIERWGANNVLQHNGDRADSYPKVGYDYCLCPIDTEFIIEKFRYRIIPTDDPRWDPCDTRIEPQ